jgi:hypothetical protein
LGQQLTRGEILPECLQHIDRIEVAFGGFKAGDVLFEPCRG